MYIPVNKGHFSINSFFMNKGYIIIAVSVLGSRNEMIAERGERVLRLFLTGKTVQHTS